MKSKMKKLLTAVLCMMLFLTSCQFFGSNGDGSASKKAQSDDGTTISIKHFNNDPHAPIEWKVKLKVNDQGETVRDGESIRYSKTGKVYEKINYVNNKKQGKRYNYHTTGKVWKEQNYLDGKLDGECKRYDRNGKITAIYYYKKGLPGVGLKEYTNLGKLRVQPVLQIQKKDEVRTSNRYKLVVSLGGENLKRIKKVEYFIGELIEGKYLHKNLQNAKPLSSKKGEFTYDVPKGSVLNKTLNVIAVAKNTDGMTLIIQKKVSVSVRGI